MTTHKLWPPWKHKIQENTNNPMLRLISSLFCTWLSLLVSVTLKNSACFPTESQASRSLVSPQLTFNLDETPEEEESTFTTHPLSPPLPPVHKCEWGKWWAKAQLTIDLSHPWPLVPSTDHSLVPTDRYVALPLAHWPVHNFNGIYGLERTQRWLVSIVWKDSGLSGVCSLWRHRSEWRL